MTALSRELARKQPANAPTQRQALPAGKATKVIEGRVVRKIRAGRMLLWILLAAAAFTFAGFLISSLQQAT